MSLYRSAPLAWLPASLLLVCSLIRAQPDDTQLAWLERVGIAARWYNVEGAPEWIDGPRPEYRTGRSLHTVMLNPAETVTVKLPAGERLRLFRPDGRIDPQAVDITWSNGSGLFAPLVGEQGSDDHSLQATPPGGGETLVRVTRSTSAEDQMELALFTSQDVNRLLATSYRETMIPIPAVPRLRLHDGRHADEYWRTDGNTPLQVEIDGATRIKIDSRLLFPEQGGPFADSYRIYAYLDGKQWRVLDLATTLDTTAAIAVEGCFRPVGLRAYGYLDLPDGARQLELRVHRPMLLQLLARQQSDDYLYEGNRPLAYSETIGHTRMEESKPYFWSQTEAELNSIQKELSRPGAAVYQAAVRVAEDNACRLGGLRASMPFAQWARRYPGQRQYQAMAARRRLLHTHYRNLMPQREINDGDTIFAWFPTPQLTEKSSPVFLADTYAQSLVGNFASGFFTKVPAAGEGVQEFLIPEKAQPSLLRIGVDRTGLSSSDAFFLQMDDAEPLRLQIETEPALSMTKFRPNTGGVALALLQKQHAAATTTLSGAFAARHAAAPLASVGFLEIPLSVPVRRLKMWRTDAGAQPLRVALAYRTSRWYQMSELGYLGLLDALGASAVHQLFQQVISSDDHNSSRSAALASATQRTAGSGLQDRKLDLYNQWLPLLRFLHSRHTGFIAGVEEAAVKSDRYPSSEPVKIENVVQRAELAERADDWQTALELWSWIQRATDGLQPDRARSRQIHALQQLGNAFLAKLLLRHDFLYAKQPAQQQQALKQLVETAHREGDLEGVLTLRAAAVVFDPHSANLKKLASALMATGRSHYALQVLLALPQADRPTERLLEAAYVEGWWSVFGQTLEASSDLEMNGRWRGYLAQLNGDYQGALAYWEQAGQAGQDLARRFTAGLEIRDGLASEALATRRQALLRWEEWQKRVLGPREWDEIPQAVIGHSGVKSLYSIDQGDYFEGFKATPEKPLTLSVYGPMSLRLRVRPLHKSTDEEPINDWIRILSQGSESRFPVIDNSVSPGLRFADDSERYPGRMLEIVYQVPAGYHELQLAGQQREVIMEVAALRARFPLALLPPLTPYTAQQVLVTGTTFGSPMPAVDDAESIPARIVQQCGKSTPLAVHPFADDQARTDPQSVITPPSEEWFRDLDSDRSHQMEKRDRSASPQRGEASAAAGRMLENQLIELLWQAEQSPEQYAANLTQAEKLVLGKSLQGAEEAILRRLRRQVSWELVRTVQESAGVRLVEFTGWHPESPALRTRKAIVGIQREDEQVISGHDIQVLSMYNLRPAEVRLKLIMQDAAYLPPQAMRVLVGWDDAPEQEVLLDPHQPEAILIKKVNVGNHLLRIHIAQPVANQFLRVRVEEQRGQVSWVISEPIQRSYSVATPDQPLMLLLKGPTRLRIDEWRAGRTLTSYRSIEPGWQTVLIPVESGREEALLRVFRPTLTPGKPTASVRIARYLANPVSEPLWPPLKTLQRPHPQVPESLALGGQEDGTWSLLGALVSRRNVDDEPQQSFDEERFLALGGAYNYFSATRDTYHSVGGRVRIREHGDPTLALRGAISIRKPDWPLDLDVTGNLFVQHLDSSGQTETATTLRARLSRLMRLGTTISHRPSLSLFQRWMSLNEQSYTDLEKVDQDIFSHYKHDHKRGLRFGDRVQYQPWLDTNLYAGAYLVSNEDLNVFDPDHLRMNIGARQLIRDLSLGVNYSRFNYFKDGDRDNDSNAQRLGIDLGFSRWLNARHGLQANLSYQYDYDSADSSIFLSVSWNRSNGRYYRDFRPSDVNFRWLRQRRALEQQAAPVLE